MGRKIEETHARNEVPIVVGGTSYWIQHLIFPERMASLDKSSEQAPTTPVSPPSQAYADAFASLPPELLALFNNLPESAPNADADPHLTLNLHRLLTMFDPLVAQRWHWRDSRKVLTNLRIIQENRRLASEIIREQSQTTSKPRSGRTSANANRHPLSLYATDIARCAFGSMRSQTSSSLALTSGWIR